MIYSSDEGFTLLEVLVAIAIMALAFGALFPIFSTSHSRVVSIEARQTAMEVASSVLAITLLERNWQSLPKEGEEGDWRWEVTRSEPTEEQLSLQDGYILIVAASVIHTVRTNFPEVTLTQPVWVQP